jgi:hypothetical protein
MFAVIFQTSSFLLFRVIHTLKPSTLIFDQLLIISIFIIISYTLLSRIFLKINFEKLVAIVCLGLFLTFLNQAFVLNVDRSRTTYVLAWVDKGLVSSTLTGELRVIGVSSPENQNIEGSVQRIQENIERGLVKVDGKRVLLTTTGNLLLKMIQITADLFSLEGWHKNNH